jgi:hypothetical protein
MEGVMGEIFILRGYQIVKGRQPKMWVEFGIGTPQSVSKS